MQDKRWASLDDRLGEENLNRLIQSTPIVAWTIIAWVTCALFMAYAPYQMLIRLVMGYLFTGVVMGILVPVRAAAIATFEEFSEEVTDRITAHLFTEPNTGPQSTPCEPFGWLDSFGWGFSNEACAWRTDALDTLIGTCVRAASWPIGGLPTCDGDIR